MARLVISKNMGIGEFLCKSIKIALIHQRLDLNVIG
jgi:hypothetical protein